MEAMSRLPSLERSSRLPCCCCVEEEPPMLTGRGSGLVDLASTAGTSASVKKMSLKLYLNCMPVARIININYTQRIAQNAIEKTAIFALKI